MGFQAFSFQFLIISTLDFNYEQDVGVKESIFNI